MIRPGEDTLGVLFDSIAEQYKVRDAIRFQGRNISYDELQHNVNIVAHGLLALGVEKNEKVGIWMPNRPQWIYVDYAVSKAGAVLVPLNTRYTVPELRYVLAAGDVTTLIMMDEAYGHSYLKVINELCPDLKHSSPGKLQLADLPKLQRIICLTESRCDGVLTFRELCDIGQRATSNSILQERQNAVKIDDPAKIFFTSGTTSFPKGAVLTHRLSLNMENVANCMNMGPDDRVAVPTYLFYIFGNLQKVLCPHLKGAAVVLLDRFDVEEVLRTIEEQQCTVLDGVPSVFNQYLSFPGLGKYKLGSLRTGRIAGAPASTRLITNIIDKLHIPELHAMYGMTECTGATTISAKGDPVELLSRTVGKAVPGAQTAVVDPQSGQKLGVDEEGELLVRGHLVLQEYYKKKAETAQAIESDGWFHTGDLVRRRGDGYFEFIGRIKDIIKRGGENVSVAEVENTICAHPAVVQCEVVGVADATYDEVGMAFVILKDGSDCTSGDITSFCRERLSSFKIPKYVQFVEEYPLTATGKVQKFKLRELAKEMGPGAVDRK